MTDNFKRTRIHDFAVADEDLRGIGHTKRARAEHKKQNRRTRRALKQELRKEWAY